MGKGSERPGRPRQAGQWRWARRPRWPGRPRPGRPSQPRRRIRDGGQGRRARGGGYRGQPALRGGAQAWRACGYSEGGGELPGATRACRSRGSGGREEAGGGEGRGRRRPASHGGGGSRRGEE